LHTAQLSLVTQRETEIAKEHYAKNNKSLALLTLKKRNYQQGLLDKTYDQLLNLEQLVHSIEFALVESQVVSGLKQGNAILGELQKELRIEDVELLLEETSEAIAYQNVQLRGIQYALPLLPLRGV
jgi:charged multivesicular body protein 6